MAALQPALALGFARAVLPTDVRIEPPTAKLPPDRARWSGIWAGWAGASFDVDLKLAVERIEQESVTLWLVRANDRDGSTSNRISARFVAGEIRGELPDGSALALRMRETRDSRGVIEIVIRWAGAVDRYLAGVLAPDLGHVTPVLEPASVEYLRIPTPFTENDQAVELEVVIVRPEAQGPCPAILFHHGSTGDGTDASAARVTSISYALAGFFVQRGWLVAFPQRRGRGRSDGLYDEGFEPDRSQYTRDPAITVAGFDRALADAGVALDWLRRRPDVIPDRLLVGGQSRGGILSVAQAAEAPGCFRGVLNFAGGWLGQYSADDNDVNLDLFRRGSKARTPMLWLYGERDSFYHPTFPQECLAAFRSEGGQAALALFSTAPEEDGHSLVDRPDRWTETVDRFLEAL